MTKFILQPDPPFPPTIIEAEAIINVGLMFADIFIIIFCLVLMLYLFNKLNDYKESIPITILYLFSLLFGMESIEHHFTHFSPELEVFFMLFQSVMFFLTSFESYSNYKKGK